LRRFWPQKCHRRVFFHRSDKSLEHQIELARFGKIAFHTFRALAIGFGRNLVSTKAALAITTID
jgi:hypothetical protein